MRPRILYFTIFIVYAVSNGRFLALFLKHETSDAGMKDSIIGILYSIKIIAAIPVITFGGYYADNLERLYPGYGRLFVLATAILLSMILYTLQGLSYIIPSIQFFSSLPWYCTIQIINGIVISILSPVLDGICLDYLQSETVLYNTTDDSNNDDDNDLDNNNNNDDDRNDNNPNDTTLRSKHENNNNQQQFGKERVFGAYSWAIMNIILSYTLDHTKLQFKVTYPMTIISSIIALITIYYYAISNNNIKNPILQIIRKNKFELLINKHDSDAILKYNDDDDDETVETTATTITNQTKLYRDDLDTVSDMESNYDDNNRTGTPQQRISTESRECEYSKSDCSRNIDCYNKNNELCSGQGIIIGLDPNDDCQTIIVNDDTHTNTSTTKATTTTIPLSSIVQMVMMSSIIAIPFSIAFVTLSSGQAIVDNLVFLFFEEIGSSYTIMGWTVVLTVSFEIPIFYIAPTLLAKFGSELLLLIAAGCYIVRVIGYTIVPSDHIMYILLLEPCHGITYACSATAAVDYISRLIPSGYEASGQSLLYLLKSVGTIIGLAMGGILQDSIGARWMYRISALVITIGNLIFAIVYLYDKQTKHFLKLTTAIVPTSTSPNDRRRTEMDFNKNVGGHNIITDDDHYETNKTSNIVR